MTKYIHRCLADSMLVHGKASCLTICIEEDTHLVLIFEREGKAIDDTAENFKQLSNPIVMFCLKDKTIKDIIDSLSDKGSVNHELPIYPMKDSLQIVTLPRVFRVKKL